MPKFRVVRSLRSRPFWCPTSATVRPVELAEPGDDRVVVRRDRGRRGARRSRRGSARRSRACTAAPDGARARPSCQISSSVGSARAGGRAGAAAARARRRASCRAGASAARACQPLAQAAARPRCVTPSLAKSRSSRASVGRSSARGTIASTWPKRKFDSARPKSSGSFSRVVCATTRGPANDISAPGSARITSPRLAKLASTPPVVGCVSTEISDAARVVQLLDRADRLRQLHQREDALLHARAARRRDRDERRRRARPRARRRARTSRRRRCPSSRP